MLSARREERNDKKGRARLFQTVFKTIRKIVSFNCSRYMYILYVQYLYIEAALYVLYMADTRDVQTRHVTSRHFTSIISRHVVSHHAKVPCSTADDLY